MPSPGSRVRYSPAHLRTHPAALLLAILCTGTPASGDELLVDGIAAQVGADIVLVSEVMDVVSRTEKRMRAAGAPESEIAKLRAEGLETMIEWRLIEKLVRDTELYATDEEVDQTVGAIAQENGISVDELKESLGAQGMPYDEYRAQMKRELERRKIVNALVANRVHLEESEVKAAYEEQFASQPTGGTQLHLRQLVVPGGEEHGRTTAEACSFVQELRKRIEAGGSFEELAQRYSAVSPQQGGDIGWIHEDTLASWMVQAVAEVEDGGVSPVVELPFGCTLVKVVGRREYEPVSYEKAKPTLHAQLFEQKLSGEYRQWMETLRDNTYIERRGYFAEASNLGSTSRQDSSAIP